MRRREERKGGRKEGADMTIEEEEEYEGEWKDVGWMDANLHPSWDKTTRKGQQSTDREGGWRGRGEKK